MNNQWEKSKEPESINLRQTPAHCSKVTSEIKGGILKQELCLFNYRHRGKLKLLFLSTLKGLTDSFGLRSTFTDVTGHQCTQSFKKTFEYERVGSSQILKKKKVLLNLPTLYSLVMYQFHSAVCQGEHYANSTRFQM